MRTALTALGKAFDEQGIGYAKTAVGDKYVYEYMAKNGCRIGGEQSGHIIFSKYASTGDGISVSVDTDLGHGLRNAECMSEQ